MNKLLLAIILSTNLLATQQAPAKRVSPVMWTAQETGLTLAAFWVVNAMPDNPVLRAAVKLAVAGTAAKVAHGATNKKIKAKL